MIADVRTDLAAFLEGGAIAGVEQVWPYLPDDVAALPCVVVDLVDGDLAPELGAIGFDVSVPLFVIGRRYGDADASTELDEVADRVLSAVRASPDWRVRSWRGRPLQVAGIDVPAYIITLEGVALTDCP